MTMGYIINKRCEMIFMTENYKGILMIVFMSLSFFMMISTSYMHALGDYVLQYIGLQSWTGDYTGFHLTIIYFGVLFLLGLYLVYKYSINKYGFTRKKVFILFIVFVSIFTIATNLTAVTIKKNSDGLFSIGFNSNKSKISYDYDGEKYTSFKGKIALKNYADETRDFYITIISPFNRGSKKVERIEVLNEKGDKVLFRLSPGENRIFKINLDNFQFSQGSHLSVSSGSGYIKNVILTDRGEKSIKLSDNNFFGLKINN